MMSKLILRNIQKFQTCSRLFDSQTRQINISKYLRQKTPLESIKRPEKKSPFPITWTSIVFSGAVGCGLLLYMYYLKEKKDLEIQRERRRTIGKSKIGGRFELVNPKGEIVKSEDFLGQWIIIYFGFTHCPDICPDEIEKMVATVNQLEKNNFKVQPIFISVDPDRDTPEVVGKYCREFSDKIIGLTGSRDQVAAACKAYRVYFSNGPKDTDNDYIVDHTIIMYLVDPEGLFVDYYGQTNTAEQVVQSVLLHDVKLKKLTGESSWLSFLPMKKNPV